MSAARRFALLVAALLAIMAGGAASVRAAATLGATVAPAPLYLDRTHSVRVDNRSAIAEDVALAFDGSGYAVDDPSFTLAPGERRTVTLTSAGPADTTLHVRVAAHEPVAGTLAASLLIEARIYHHGPPEPPWSLVALVAAITVFLGTLILRRKLQ